MAQWNLTIPDETDRSVRSFLERNGQNAEDISEFVNDAVRRRIFELTVSQVKKRNAHYDQAEIRKIIDEEVAAVRMGRSAHENPD